MKQIAAIIIGLIIGGIFIIGGETVIHSVSSLKIPGENATKKELFDYVQQIPIFLKVLLVMNWGIGIFIAGLTASFINGRTVVKPSIIVAGILQILIYLNMMLIPGHPTWVIVTTTFMCIPLGMFAHHVIRIKKMIVEGDERETIND